MIEAFERHLEGNKIQRKLEKIKSEEELIEFCKKHLTEQNLTIMTKDELDKFVYWTGQNMMRAHVESTRPSTPVPDLYATPVKREIVSASQMIDPYLLSNAKGVTNSTIKQAVLGDLMQSLVEAAFDKGYIQIEEREMVAEHKTVFVAKLGVFK